MSNLTINVLPERNAGRKITKLICSPNPFLKSPTAKLLSKVRRLSNPANATSSVSLDAKDELTGLLLPPAAAVHNVQAGRRRGDARMASTVVVASVSVDKSEMTRRVLSPPLILDDPVGTIGYQDGNGSVEPLAVRLARRKEEREQRELQEATISSERAKISLLSPKSLKSVKKKVMD